MKVGLGAELSVAEPEDKRGARSIHFAAYNDFWMKSQGTPQLEGAIDVTYKATGALKWAYPYHPTWRHTKSMYEACMKKPKTREDGYSDSYFSEGEIYQIMEEAEEQRSKKKKEEKDGWLWMGLPEMQTDKLRKA